MTYPTTRILDGNTFVISDSCGDIDATPTDTSGLFSFDTRFLSKWILTVNGQRLNALSTDDMQYFETRYVLVPGSATIYANAKLSVIRQRAVGEGFHEELMILNHDEVPVDLTVRIDADADFADLFEVKDAMPKKGRCSHRVEGGGHLLLGYVRESFVRETTISTSAAAEVDVSDRLQPSGLVHGGAHAAAPDDAGSGTGRGPPRDRPGSADGNRPHRAAGHP